MSDADTGIVTFVYADWSLIYPELVPPAGTTTEAMATNDFNIATLYLNNTPGSIVGDTTRRTTLLYLLTAHIAAIAARQGIAPGLIGAITSASQGSVSVGATIGAVNSNQVWYYQTPYGMAYWQATMAYRAGGRYKPGRVPYLGVTNPGYRGGFRGY